MDDIFISQFINMTIKYKPFVLAHFIKHMNDDGYIGSDHLEVDGIIRQVGILVLIHLL